MLEERDTARGLGVEGPASEAALAERETVRGFPEGLREPGVDTSAMEGAFGRWAAAGLPPERELPSVTLVTPPP